MKVKLSLTAVLLLVPISILAQIDKETKEFDNFVKQQQQEFENFVDKQNKEFANFLKENWKEYYLESPIARPQRPEPVKPVYYDKNKPTNKPQELKIGEVTRMPIPEVTPSTTFPSFIKKTPVPVIAGGEVPIAQPYIKPKAPTAKPTSQKKPARKPETKPIQKTSEHTIPIQPVKPINKPDEEKQRSVELAVTPPISKPTRTGIEFVFYGETYAVNASLKNSLILNGITEKDIASGWENLSRRNYQSLIEDCLATKKEAGLNDYGYLSLSKCS